MDKNPVDEYELEECKEALKDYLETLPYWKKMSMY